MTDPTTSAGISDEHLELLASLLEQEGYGDGSRPAAIPRRPEGGEVPLSFAQQRLWFLDQWQPGTAQYNLHSAVRLGEPLDPELLERAVNEVVRRHESLRTTFAAAGGRAVQVISPALFLPVAVHDLRALPAAEREAEVERRASAEARRPFDLARGPLLRVAMLRCGEPGDVLLLTMHHIVSDGWSMEVLTRELATLYGAFARGLPSPLPEPAIQYADFAAWQREWLQGEVLEEQLGYWRRQLAGAPPVLELPADHPRPPMQSFRGGGELVRLGPALQEGLREVGRAEGATPFMALLAGFAALLERYTGRDDLLVGSPIANRNRPELEGLIGFFANTLVLRADLAGDPTFRELLGRVRRTTLEAYDHQDLPFEKLVEELRPERDPAHAPLCQVVFALQTAGGAEARAEAPWRELLVRNGTAKFDLTLSLIDAPGSLGGIAEYASDLFTAPTIRRLLGHFATLLAGAAADPGRRLSELPLLTPEEQAQLAAAPAAGPWTGDLPCVHERFAAEAARRPLAPAVTCDGETVSYGDLDRRANRLAHRLRAAGVGPEIRVALCLDRSLDLVIAVLATLKAGGAYVPLDPAYPAERLGFILGDTAAAVLVTRSDVDAELPELPEQGARRLLLDDGFAAPPEWDERAPDGGAGPANAAYVIHTSGSTGRPKGVVVPHAAVARLFAATAPWFGFGEEDVWTLFHSYAFDFSVWELWGALAHGGRLVVVPHLTSRSPEAFLELLRRERVTVLSQTPSAFYQLAAAEAAAPVADLALRWVIFGGEALDPASLAPWLERHGEERPRLVNMYGITETTVHVTYRPLGRADRGARSPLGVPIPDLSLVLLDPRGRPVPVGVPGELQVGGAGLARGYLGRPDLTAERFVPDPFAAAPGARLYRSGDLARRLADGEVEYLGRADGQVKVRGFRIEPGEVEAALAAHPGVREAVVVAAGERTAPRLVAYYTAAEPAPAAAELRAFLAALLPDYMVPAVFVPLARLPLTVHGKVDRRALPEPSGARPDAGEGYAAPRTLAEEALAAIWSQVLGVDAVGVDDNFFALGGDSIRSLQVLALARERGIELSLPQLFRRQTIAELAAEAGEAAGESGARFRTAPFSLVPEADRARLPEGLEDAYPLAMLQAGMLFHMAMRPEEPPYHNVDSWHLRARFAPEPFRRAVADVVARHPVMRTSFHLNAFSEPLQLVHTAAEVPLEVADLTHLAEDEQRREIEAYVAAEKRRLFDFTRPPQLRIQVHLRSAETFQFTLTENHAIFDGWSLHSTLAEIFSRYFALLRGDERAPEPPLPLAYRDFVAAEQRLLDSEECRESWRRRLEGATVLELPSRPPASGEAGEGRTRRLEAPLPEEVSDRLRRLSRTAAVPLKSVLLAAHFRVLALLSGQTDVMTGVVFNGRPEEPGGDQLRGLFLNTLPLRLRLGDESWADLVRRTFAVEREVLPLRRYPLNVLQQERGGQPLFDVIFNYVHFHVVQGVLRSGDVAVLDFQGAEGTNYLLQVAFTPGPPGGGVHFALEYDSARLPEEQARWIAGYFHRVFAAMAAAPEAAIAGPELLAPEERAQLAAWSEPVEHPAGATLHELFAAQVDRDPGAPAVSCEGEELTYGELDRRSNRLARRLRREGVGRGTLVAVSLERSLDLVVGLVAVLKAGGAYVPVDPGYPQERRAYLLADSGAPVLLSRERLAAGLPTAWMRTVLLDDLEPPLAAESDERPDSGAGADDPAYVIYTSGSTGKPKGVVVRHGNVARLLAATAGWFGFGPADVWTLFHSYAFDFSVWEMWGALAYGGRLVVVPQLVSRSPEAFHRLLREERVTVLNQTPSAFRQLAWAEEHAVAAAGPEAAELALRFVIFGGEALDLPSLAPWFERHGDERPVLVNMYGITETTVHVTYRPLSRADLAGAPGSRIGRAIPDLAVHVLDAWGVPAPLGVRGEMFVGGAGLAIGYLGRPELTAERFQPDPFAARPGARLYRSGDLARRLPDGDLEYLGRGDDQVKIRGFRIELGEIAAAASTHPAVRQVVVVPREDAAGERRLVAYVATDDFGFETDELAEHLRARLPEYMVPAAIVKLAAIPLTANGKVDLAALPVPAGVRPTTRKAFVAPRTPLEERLAAIWCEVLRLDRVGVDDSFFELGGNSLLVAQVFARLRDALGVEVPMRKLFEEPTVARLAAVIEEENAGRGIAEAPRIERRGREGRRAEQAQAKLDQLSPEEVRRLLEERRARQAESTE